MRFRTSEKKHCDEILKQPLVKTNQLFLVFSVISALALSLSCNPSKSVKNPENEGLKPSLSLAATPGSGANLQLVQQAEQLKAKISARVAELENQRDRQGKIVNELLNQTDQGCFASVKLKNFEILLAGSWLPRKGRGKTGSPMSSRNTGNPSTITFQFGDQIAVVNNEASSSMFQPAGRKVVTDFVDLTLADIEYLKISKGGTEFDSERGCRKTGLFGWGGTKCSYQNYEEKRYELDSIELKVNGETFYKRSAIKFQFEDGALDWSDNSMKVNEAFLRIMKREDCPQS